jgi:alkylation response protein AidB-like acyl-CoA dehydrogenase
MTSADLDEAQSPATTDNLRDLRDEVRALVREWRDSGRFVPRCDSWLRGYDHEFSRALGERGWIGMTWPREVGGGGRSYLARSIVTAELLRAGAPVAAHWIADRQIGPAILRYGTPDLQQRFLPGIRSAEITFCLGMSETEAGSDLASVRTRGTLSPLGWRLNGAKVWTSQAHRSTHAYVLARTGTSDSKHEGLTELVVDLTTPGVTIRPILDMGAEHHFNEVIFDDVLVPEANVIGAVGNGWAQVTSQLSYERGGAERVLSTYPLLAEMIRRVDPGDSLGVHTIGHLAGRLLVLMNTVYRIAAAMDRGLAPINDAAVLKLLGSAFEQDVNEAARDVFGLEPDLFADDELARLLGQGLMAQAGFTIRGGTSEILSTIVAKAEGRQ